MLTSKKQNKVMRKLIEMKNNKRPKSLKILTERSNSTKWKCPLNFLSRPKLSGRLPSSQSGSFSKGEKLNQIDVRSRVA